MIKAFSLALTAAFLTSFAAQAASEAEVLKLARSYQNSASFQDAFEFQNAQSFALEMSNQPILNTSQTSEAMVETLTPTGDSFGNDTGFPTGANGVECATPTNCGIGYIPTGMGDGGLVFGGGMPVPMHH